MSTEAPVLEYAPPDAALAHRKRGLLFLCMAVACVGVAMTIQTGINSNFVAQQMHLSGFQQGMLEAARESCGIFALVVLALLAGIAEPVVGAIMLVLLAAGLSAYAYVPSFGWLVAMSLVWSQGLHVWMPLPSSMAMALAEPGRVGRRLAQVGVVGAVGSAMGLALALLLSWLGVPMRILWLVAGAAALGGVVACLAIPRQIMTERPRLVIRREYGLYYGLSFLEGWRKQIFIAFAGFLLTRTYGTPLNTMLMLWLGSNVAGWLVQPLVGRWIDRFGERPVLSVYYTCMVLLFVGYATITSKHVLWALFAADNTFFIMGMALTTYVNRIAPPAERTPTLSMGVAMNHVGAVLMPLIGAAMWNDLSYKWLFVLGACVAAVSVLAARWVPPKGVRLRSQTN